MRGKLHNVAPDQIHTVQLKQSVQQFRKSYASGFRRAGAGKNRRVQHIQIQREVWNMEQFDPDPFLKDLGKYGLPWQCVDVTGKI